LYNHRFYILIQKGFVRKDKALFVSFDVQIDFYRIKRLAYAVENQFKNYTLLVTKTDQNANKQIVKSFSDKN
jgi:hypothetical protein